MKIDDIKAIRQMDPKAHLYLEVVGKGNEQYLTVKHKGFFGRLWMKLGFSSASMENISRYILQNADQFSRLDALEKEKFDIFKQKLSHYVSNHRYAKISAQALALLNIKHSAPANKLESDLESDRQLKRNDDIKALIAQFESSAPQIYPYQGSVVQDKERVRKLYHAEADKLETFLRLQNQADHPTPSDLVYICVGHADVDEQVWPGFIFQALAKNQKVSTLLFEQGWRYPEFPITAWRQMKRELDKQPPEVQEAVKERISHFSVQQFLCGLPEANYKVEEELTEKEKNIYPLLGNVYWEKRHQINTVLVLFANHIEKLLKEGKSVVLGAHAGSIDSKGSLEEIYNRLVSQYPNQIHFLWGWGKCNLFTHQKINPDDMMHPEAPTPIWAHHDHLGDCYLLT